MKIKELAATDYNQALVVHLDRNKHDAVIEDRFIVSAGQLTAAGFGECDLEPDNIVSFGSPSVFNRLKKAVEEVRRQRNTP